MRLNTDNPQTQPITDAVYGKAPKRADKPERKRRERTLFEALDPATARTLERLQTKRSKP